MVYQTRVLQDQFSASVWPYLSVENDVYTHSTSIHLVNQGVGPALIRSAQLLLDGKPLEGWTLPFFRQLLGTSLVRGAHLELGDSTVDASTALRAGDSMQLIALKSPQIPLRLVTSTHDVELRFCYCSINGKCWTLDSHSNSDTPALPIASGGCAQHYQITAPSDVLDTLRVWLTDSRKNSRLR